MKHRLTTFLIACFAAFLAWNLPAAEELPPEAFLRMVGKVGAMQKSFAVLSGELQHYRKNAGEMERYPVRFAIRMEAGQTEAKLQLNNGKETYRIRRDAFLRSHDIEPAQAGELLAKVGVEPADLVMGFLDGDFVREELPETVKTVPCRVFVLRSKEAKTVKVWIASEYFFSLKAEFYRAPEALGEAPELERTLELTGFKKVKDRYVPTDMAILTKEFRTRITFKDCEILEPGDPRVKTYFAETALPKQGK